MGNETGQAQSVDILDSEPRNTEDMAVFGVSKTKEEKIGWAAPGQPGEFCMLPKQELHLDAAYQRGMVESHVRNIASGFDWRLFGVLIVVKRHDGRYWVIDGGHRLRAALRRASVEKVPCLVFPASAAGEDALCEEAQLFVDGASVRVAIKSVERFRAGILAGNEVDVEVKRLLDMYSLRAVGGGTTEGHGEFAAISAIKRCVVQDKVLTARVFKLCVEVADGGVVQDVLLRGAFVLAQHLSPFGREDLLLGRGSRALCRLGMAGIARVVREEKHICGRGGALVEARAILNAINKDLRTKKLVWVDHA